MRHTCAADFVLLDRAQHSAGRDLLECVQLGGLPGVGMVVIDGLPRIGRSFPQHAAGGQGARGSHLAAPPMRGADAWPECGLGSAADAAQNITMMEWTR